MNFPLELYSAIFNEASYIDLFDSFFFFFLIFCPVLYIYSDWDNLYNSRMSIRSRWIHLFSYVAFRFSAYRKQKKPDSVSHLFRVNQVWLHQRVRYRPTPVLASSQNTWTLLRCEFSINDYEYSSSLGNLLICSLPLQLSVTSFQDSSTRPNTCPSIWSK